MAATHFTAPHMWAVLKLRLKVKVEVKVEVEVKVTFRILSRRVGIDNTAF